MDEAVNRIKELMKTQKMSENDGFRFLFLNFLAIAQWDTENERIQRINKKEVEMLNQDAEKAGNCLTALDAFKIVKQMRKYQLESQTFREFRLKYALDDDAEDRLNLIRKIREPEFPKQISQSLINDSLKRKLVQVKEIREIVTNIMNIKRSKDSFLKQSFHKCWPRRGNFGHEGNS
jgi:hypothetical protein